MKILKEDEAEDFLEKNGFKVVKRGFSKDYKSALDIATKIGFPVVLKNTNLLHKTEKSGVKLNVNKDDFEKTFKELKSNNILIQKQTSGVEFLMGIKKDNTFGHVITFGLGGIYTEVFKDVSFRVYPIKEEDAEEMINEIKFSKIFDARNVKVNKKNIIENILKLNNLIKKNSKITELDINPLIANDKEALIVDARIVMD
ncbi:MAG: acetate--CoA ligase family protein [Candidatus Nanoarchaeia archaeon]